MPSASTLVHAVSAIESAVSPSARYTIAFDIVPPGEQPSVISVSATCGARSNARATAYATAGISSHCDARPTPRKPRWCRAFLSASTVTVHAMPSITQQVIAFERITITSARPSPKPSAGAAGGGDAGGAASDSARPRSDGAATTRAAAASSDGVPPTEAAAAGANSAAEAPITTDAFISPRGRTRATLSVTGGGHQRRLKAAQTCSKRCLPS